MSAYRIYSLVSEYLLMAWTALRSHKLRSFLTTLGIFIGVTTIITIWTTIQGLNSYITGAFADIGQSVLYVEKMPWVITDNYWKYRNRDDITWKEYEAIEAQSRLADQITPQVVSMKRVGYEENKFDNIPILGTTESFLYTAGTQPEVGRFLTTIDVRNRVPVVILGAELAERLFEKQNPIGRRIKIDGEKYRVVGVLERQGEFFGQTRDNYAVVPIGTFQRVYGGHRGMQIAVMTNNPDMLDDLKEELRGILRRVRKVEPADEDNFALNQQSQLTDFYQNTTKTLYGVIIIIAGISLLVGGIGITNIMMVSVTERTKEIGLRKAVGATRSNILTQFLFESVSIASVGGVVGIAAGIAAGGFVLGLMQVDEGIGLSSIIVGFGFSTFVGVVSGFYPAYKASKLNPIDSLRYE